LFLILFLKNFKFLIFGRSSPLKYDNLEKEELSIEIIAKAFLGKDSSLFPLDFESEQAEKLIAKQINTPIFNNLKEDKMILFIV
tara:strand:- start:729 stop:980 length:252 start_codon:yes stop_codon:yes gene_type:complete